MNILLMYAILSFPIAVIWSLLIQFFDPIAFAMGYVIGFVALVRIFGNRPKAVSPARLIMGFFGLIIYAVFLLWDIMRSSIDVALRVLNVLPVKPGIVKVQVKDKRDVVKALTAHGITITPGQLVVEFGDDDSVYVHCINVETFADELDDEQERRLKYLNRIVGK